MKIIWDFIESGKSVNGVGMYYGDKCAVRISSTISKQQIRRFKKHGEIPSAFFRYLHERGVIHCPFRLNGKSVSDLLDVLWKGLKDGKRKKGTEFLTNQILLSLDPKLRSGGASQQGVWEKLILYCGKAGKSWTAGHLVSAAK